MVVELELEVGGENRFAREIRVQFKDGLLRIGCVL